MRRLKFALLPALLAACGSEPPPPPAAPAAPEPVLLTGRAVSASASSEAEYKGVTYAAKLAVDGDSTTAWCEGTEGLGEGETLTLDLGKEVTIKSLGIQGGFYKDDRALINNGRLRKATVESDQGWSAEAEFFFVPERKYKAKKVHVMTTPVPNAAGKTARVLTLRIDEADEGQFTKDVCVSEVVIEVE
mgnify:CR=1 FL=1